MLIDFIVGCSRRHNHCFLIIISVPFRSNPFRPGYNLLITNGSFLQMRKPVTQYPMARRDSLKVDVLSGDLL